MRELRAWVDEEGGYRWEASDELTLSDACTMACLIIGDTMVMSRLPKGMLNDKEGTRTEETNTQQEAPSDK